MTWTAVKVRNELLDQVKAMAEVENRSTANMLEVLLREALARAAALSRQ